MFQRDSILLGVTFLSYCSILPQVVSAGEICDLCPFENQIPHKPWVVLTYKSETTGMYETTTCGDAQRLARLGAFNNCAMLHYISVYFCDCGAVYDNVQTPSPTPAPTPAPTEKPPPETCTLCTDRKPMANENKFVAGKTCHQWELEANSQDSQKEGHCHIYQAALGIHCGCNAPNWNMYPYRTFCRICPEAEKMVDPTVKLNLGYAGTKYCVELEKDMNTDVFERCALEQRIYGPLCNCQNVPSPPPVPVPSPPVPAPAPVKVPTKPTRPSSSGKSSKKYLRKLSNRY